MKTLFLVLLCILILLHIFAIGCVIYEHFNKRKTAEIAPTESDKDDLKGKNLELQKKLWDEHARFVKLKLEHELLQKLIDDITKRQTDQ